MNLNRLASVAAAALAVTALAACSASGDDGGDNADGTTTLTVALVGLSQDAALSLGVDQGYFESRGISIETTVVANPPAAIAAVQGGQVDIAYTPSIPLLNALNEGVPVQVVAAADGYPDGAGEADDAADIDDTAIIVNPDSGFTSTADLEGKTVAVPARNAQMEVTIAAVIEDAGGDPSTVNWVVLDFASAVEAVKGGTVDAAGLVNPFFGDALSQGMELLASPGVGFFEQGAVGLYVTSQNTATENADAIVAFREAAIESNGYANDNIDEAMARGQEITGVDIDPSEMTPVYWPTEVRLEDIENVNSRLVELGYLDAEVDLSGVFLDGTLAG
ncbi:MAG: ABC transporter substrate-binding protein [Pseudoclavibacter sp.]